MGGSSAAPANDRQAAGVTSASALVLRIQAALLSQSGLHDGATALATELAKGLGCERVTVGWLEHGAVRVIGCSYVTDLDARRALFEKIAAAMDEAIEQGTAILLSSGETTSHAVTLAHREALALGSGSLCSVRLLDHGRPVGAITLERKIPPLGPAECGFCQDLACLLGPLLELKRRSMRSAARVALEACRELLGGPAAVHLRARRWILATLAAAAGAVLVPVPYHVGAPARLEGSLQRVVAAPIDGFLEQVGARPGDRVRANQVLAEMSLRDLNTERSKRQSELAQHENLYGAALARADRTQLVIHHAKAAEVSAQLALIEHQLERARIRAPFDGVVLKGDLTQSIGAPVQRGEVLMTLAPDESFRLIVEVDERDIAHLQPGQPGRLALAATPGETLAFRVHRILPVANAADGRTFFEVEAAFERASATLRPGLRGVAKISVGKRSVAWIATHRALDWLRLQLWSLGA
jgi:multidrug efflux pump subunit AcrA (membrane-fusion protein)